MSAVTFSFPSCPALRLPLVSSVLYLSIFFAFFLFFFVFFFGKRNSVRNIPYTTYCLCVCVCLSSFGSKRSYQPQQSVMSLLLLPPMLLLLLSCRWPTKLELDFLHGSNAMLHASQQQQQQIAACILQIHLYLQLCPLLAVHPITIRSDAILLKILIDRQTDCSLLLVLFLPMNDS